MAPNSYLVGGEDMQNHPADACRGVNAKATDNGEAFPSRRFEVQVQAKAESQWETVWKTDENLSKSTVVSFTPREVQKIRVVQEPEGGSSARPNLMWVEQVAIAR